MVVRGMGGHQLVSRPASLDGCVFTHGLYTKPYRATPSRSSTLRILGCNSSSSSTLLW
jgi:hypothetical protein